jgi:hypothetical protein
MIQSFKANGKASKAAKLFFLEGEASPYART